MLKLTDKKIITILRSKVLFIITYKGIIITITMGQILSEKNAHIIGWGQIYDF